MSKAKDILDEADFDDEDMKLLHNRTSWQSETKPGTATITSLMSLIKQLNKYQIPLAEINRDLKSYGIEAADDAIMAMRDIAHKVISHCDALDDELAGSNIGPDNE